MVGFLVNMDVVAVLPHSAWGTVSEIVPRTDVQQVMPQGWGFFTRNPREPKSYTYGKPDGREWRAVETEKISSARWLFGISRAGRVQRIEIDRLSEGLSKDAWISCGAVEHVTCLNSLSTEKAVTLVNSMPHPEICGTVGFVAEDTMPWAWRSDADKLRMPVKGVLAEVECPGK